MTLYAARDASGTVHIGDGVTRRALHDAAVYSTMIYRGGAKTGPQILDVRGQPAPGNPALLSIENPVVLESLGQLI